MSVGHSRRRMGSPWRDLSLTPPSPGGRGGIVQHLAECNEGDELILEYKRSGLKGYIEVLPVNGVSSIEVGDEDEHDDVPDIDLDDDEKESGDSTGKSDEEADIQIPDTL